MMDTTAFTKDNKFLMLALDHRSSFRKLLNPKDPEKAEALDAIEAKKTIIEALHSQISGLLIDMDYGMEAYATANIDTPKPFLIAMEKSGYVEKNGERTTQLETSAYNIKEQGALGTKLLIQIDLEASNLKNQIQTAKEAVEDSHDQKMPFFLEIITYGETKGKITEAVAKVLQGGVKPDVFKLEYPGDEKSCKIITEFLRDIPWILLTRGADFDIFAKNLAVAAKNGCRGFLAGRALWQEYFSIKDTFEKKKFLNEILPKRFEEISKLV